MKTQSSLLFILLVFVFSYQLINAQLVYIAEEDSETVEIVGNWRSVDYEDCHGGSAVYTRKGDGSSWVKWYYTFDFPGPYQLETYVRDYKYGQDTRWTISTGTGDTTVIVDEYYNPGWHVLGTFDFDANTSITLSNYFESDTGDYVYGDAIRFTSMMPLYSISGNILLNGQNQHCDTYFKLEKYGIQAPIAEAVFSKTERQYSIDNLTPGYYKITCYAWGYDTLIVDSLEIIESDLPNQDLTLDQSSGSTYAISGILKFDDSSDSSECFITLLSKQSGLLVSSDTVKHLERYSLLAIPPGSYMLQFTADGYLDDLETYSALLVEDSDVLLDTMLMYAYFNFAWITDTHVGAGFTEAGLQTVMQNINHSDEDLRFVINTGDLTEKGLSNEISEYYSYISDCCIPVYNIPGNHDTKWTETGMESFKNRNNGATHFSFDYQGYHFVGINSGIPMRGGGGYIDPAELDWLKNDLEQLPEGTPVIACVHHPADAGGIFNNWKFLDILKDYHTIFLMVGHGHSNRSYNFDYIPGAMSLDTYSSSSGYNVVSVSKKEIALATHYTGTGLAGPWLVTPYIEEKQPEIRFTDLTEFDQITASRIVNIYISEPASSGRYKITTDTKTGTLDGSGSNWSLTLPFDGMSNGYHTLTVWFNIGDGKEYSRTIGYYIENDYPRCAWKYHAGSQIISSPAYDQNNTYFGTIDGKIYGLSLLDGTEVWPAVSVGKTIFSSPYVTDGIVYIGASDGNLYAISADSGNVIWTYDAGAAVLSAITGIDSAVFLAANNKMIAVHSKTGEKIWAYSADGTIECRPAIQGDKIIFGSWDTKVHCLNRFDGSLLWKWNEQTSFYYSPAACWPVATADKVFVADPARYLNAIDINTGNTVWRSKSPETWESIGISDRKHQVYIRSLDGSLYAFSATATSQQQLWKASAGYGWDSTPSMPIGKNGAVITGSKNGFVISVGQENGQVGWRYWLSHSYVTTVAAIDGGTVLAAALDGTLMKIEADPALSYDNPGDAELPFKSELYPAYPNPFNNQTTIRYSLGSAQEISIRIYNILGQNLLSIDRQHKNPGNYSWTWDGKDKYGLNLSSGLYIIRMIADDYTGSQKLLFLK